MKTAGPSFPLFNRIAVFVLCSGMLVFLAYTLATPKFRRQLDIAEGLLLAIFAVLACGGIWLSLSFKNRTREGLDEEAALPSLGQPKISPNAIVCRFPSLTKTAAVFVDADAGVIHFKDCHVPRKFLTSAQPWFSCPIKEIKGVHVHRYRGEYLTIVTAAGKAIVPSLGTDYVEFRKLLKELAPQTQPGFSTDHPMMGMVYLAGALSGLFAGVALTPKNAGDSTLGLFVLAGTTLGIVLIHLLVLVADRGLKIGLAQPIGFGMMGACAGLSVDRLVNRGFDLKPMIAFVVAGLVIGVVGGIVKQSREESASRRN